MKVRRTFAEADPADERMFRAYSPTTGEMCECSNLVTLLQRISASIVADPRSQWTVFDAAEARQIEAEVAFTHTG